jgi:hypothetical protein
MKKIIIAGLIFCASFLSFQVKAQLVDIGTLLSGSETDAEILLQEYLKPYANAFGADINSAWYNTAKNHKKLGFDITFSLSASFVPSADKTFDASTLGLTGAVSGPTSSPTIAGKKTDGQTISYPAIPGLSYQLPKGTNWGIIPAPMIQVGIGLVKETDLVFRFIPKLNIGDFGKFGLWGIGVKHSLKQYIPGIKLAPFFHLSVFLGYTRMKTTANISLPPTIYNDLITPEPVITATASLYENQSMEMVFNGFTGNILASFDLPVFTVYGGAGIYSSSANFKLLGNYPVPSYTGTQVEVNDANNIANPLDISIKSSKGVKPRLNAGVKFKMAVITLSFDYTVAKYSTITAGLGLSFR